MTLSEELAEKYWSEFCDNPELSAKEQVAAAINEAIERCAQECRPREQNATEEYWGDIFAARIRALGKSEAKS